ncbi:MAG: hypothetical protein ACYCX2_07610 [Christensenellales bacterium]
MKSLLNKILCACLCIILLFVSMIAQSASAQDESYSAKPPVYDIVPLGSTNIKLDQRSVNMDMSVEQLAGSNPLAYITAEYLLTNPTANKESVKIAFPYIAPPIGTSLALLDISSDGIPVPLEISLDRDRITSDYFRNQNVFQEAASLSNLLKKITQAPYVLEPYGKNRGIVYSISAAPANDADPLPTADGTSNVIPAPSADKEPLPLDITVTFDVLSEDTLIIAAGYKHMTCRDDTHYTLTTQVKDGDLSSLGIIVIGTLLKNFTVSADSADHPDQVWDTNYQMDYILLRDFINSHISSLVSTVALPESSSLSLEHLYSIVGSDINDHLSESQLLFLENSMMSLYENCLTISVFELSLEPHTSKSLAVSYMAQGTTDQTNSSAPLCRYAYICDSSGGWSSDNDTSFQMITSNSYPYITHCSYPFSRQGNQNYLSEISAFQSDFTFSTYSKGEVDYIKKVNTMENYVVYFIIGGAFIIIMATVAVIVLYRNRKKPFIKAMKKRE